MNDVHIIRIDVLAIQFDSAFQTRAWNEIVHTIQRPQESRLPTTRRTNQCGDELRPDLYGHIMQRMIRPVEKIGVADVDLYGIGHLISWWLPKLSGPDIEFMIPENVTVP